MEFLFPLEAIRRVGLFLFLVAATAAAKDYCSLTVEVANARGYKPTGVSVSLVEDNGRVETATTNAGEAKFCDLGISRVTLTIGERDRCNEIVVRNVALNWDTERVLNVLYDREYCNGDELQSIGCSVLLRFVDEQGKSIPDVQFEPPVGRLRNAHSDTYGRALVGLRLGETVIVAARSPNYMGETIELRCSTTSKRELIVTLHRPR